MSTQENTPIRIVLADDQPLVLDGIATILSAEPDFEVVGRAHTGQQAVEVITEAKPDVVCMDIEMPGVNGIEATARILQDSQRHRPEVIMLTTFNREDYLLSALEAGASGFLLKTSTPEQLAAGIRTVANGEALLSPEVTRTLIQHTVQDGNSPISTVSPTTSKSIDSNPTDAREVARVASDFERQISQLTARETEVLTYAALGLSNAEIGERMFVGAETVKTHMSNILAKLHLRNRVAAVTFAYRSGLMSEHSP